MSVLSSTAPVTFSSAKDTVYIDSRSGRVELSPEDAIKLANELKALAKRAETWGKQST